MNYVLIINSYILQKYFLIAVLRLQLKRVVKKMTNITKKCKEKMSKCKQTVIVLIYFV